jgi:hypothetical protein
MRDAEYWRQVAYVWLESGYIYRIRRLWRRAWSTNRPMKHCTMDDAELEQFNDLPECITVYRGQWHRNVCGLSWSLNPAEAICYANYWLTNHGKGWLLTGWVNRRYVHAYLNSRYNQQELVATNVRVICTTSKWTFLALSYISPARGCTKGKL